MKPLSFLPPVIAHRGASAYAPENTFASFTKAIQLGATWVEFDVQLSRDGEVVIFHDATLDRTTNGHGALDGYSLAYLQSLDAGKWFGPSFSQERILSLQQAMTFLADKGISVNIELKPNATNTNALVAAVLRVMQPFSCAAIQVLYSSFSFDALRYLRQMDGQSMIGLLMDTALPNWQPVADELSASAIHLNHHAVTDVLAAEILATNRLLTCYTVNQVERAKELYTVGVNAIFTDKPDIILAL